MPLVTRRAEQGSLFSNLTEPTDITKGNLWVDTSLDQPAISVSNGTNYDNIQVKLNKIVIPIGVLL